MNFVIALNRRKKLVLYTYRETCSFTSNITTKAYEVLDYRINTTNKAYNVCFLDPRSNTTVKAHNAHFQNFTAFYY